MPRKKRLSLGIAIGTLFAIFLWSTSDLLIAPREVRWSRKQYRELLSSYKEDRADWDAQRRKLIGELSKSSRPLPPAAHNIPLEVVLSYLVESLGFAEGEFEGVALYPAQDVSSMRFYISKYEEQPFPFRVLLSLEAQLEYKNGRWDVKFLHFRRGRRELPAGLAWIYLGPELQRLRTFDSFAELAPGLALGPSTKLSAK